MKNTHLVTSRKAVAVLLIKKKTKKNIELIVGCKLIKITTENL